MKRTTNLLLTAAIMLTVQACEQADNGGGSGRDRWACGKNDTNWTRPFISVEEADSMVESYLTSINYQSEDSNVRSFVVDANALRKYLVCGDGRNISHMKIMLAHNKSYIRNGGYGRPCGYSDDALTVVMAGFNSAGDYVYAPTNKVMDFSSPCPKDCPKIGTAAGDLLPLPAQR